MQEKKVCRVLKLQPYDGKQSGGLVLSSVAGRYAQLGEFAEHPLRGKGKSSAFYKAILSLRVGENLFISKDEWKGYKTPTRICRYIMKKYPNVKYSFGKLADGSGWVMKRKK